MCCHVLFAATTVNSLSVTMVTHTITFKSAWNLFHNVHKYKNVIGNNRKYSDYQDGSKKKIRVFARSLLNMISGGDMYNLLNDILGPKGVAKLKPFDQV